MSGHVPLGEALAIIVLSGLVGFLAASWASWRQK